MSEITSYEPGRFCWIEIGTTDTAAAKKFYAELLDWEPQEVDAGPEGPYTMMRKGGKDVCGLYQLSEQQRSQGVPPHWLSYISVAGADEASRKATSLGGTVLMGPFDVLDVGRMALVQDPTGAMFALWEARRHFGSRVMYETGSLCWSELGTRDMDDAARFYAGLFGWRAMKSSIPDMQYTEFFLGNRAIAGMYALPPEAAHVPPNWLSYIMVEDCDTAAEKAAGLGGKVVVQPGDIPNVGRFAILQDPLGAQFAIIRLNIPA